MGQVFKSDTYSTPLGEITVTPIGHGSLMIAFDGKVIHIDPYGSVADYAKLPKADLILITHEHSDHFDPEAIAPIRKPDTEIISTRLVAERMPGVRVVSNGETTDWDGIRIEAVPAYNIQRMRSPGVPYHPKGDGNGYVLNFGDFRLYVAGDTELIPEMKELGKIDVAFLPKMLPYTMSDDEFLEAARGVHPKALYPYHFLKADRPRLREELPGIEIR